MRTAPLATIDPEDDAGIADGETIFNGLLLAVIGRRRLLVLVGDAPATRVGLLARLARHVEAEGCMVMTVAAATGVTVEDLIEVAGASMLGSDYTPADFEALVEALEERLDLAGTGVMMVEEADRLSPDTLRDLVELSGSVSPSGRFLQVLLSGGPELRNRLEQADLLPTVEAVGTIYTIGPTVTPERDDLRIADDGPIFAPRKDTGREKPSRKGGWLAFLMIGVLGIAGAAYLYDAGVLEDERITDLLGLERPAATSVATGPADTRSGLEPTRDRVADVSAPTGTADTAFNTPPEVPSAGRTGTAAGDAATQAQPAPAQPTAGTVATSTPPAAEEPTRYSAEDVERFSELAGRVLSGEDVPAEPAPAAGSASLPDPARQAPPPEESQPLDDEELAELDSAEQAADEKLAQDAASPAREEDVALAPPPGPTQAEARQLRTLASRAEAQFAARKLTTPQADNAFTTLQEIRAIDPRHPLLADLRRRILETYQAWANTAEARQDWQTARVYYQRALRVDPANPAVTAKLDAVDDRLAGRPQVSQSPPQPEDAPPEPRLRP